MHTLRGWYAQLLRLYPKPHRERFGESMEQTFNDLYRERRRAGDRLFRFVLWVFVETFAGIIRENMMFMLMQDITKRLVVWAAVVTVISAIPAAMMFFGVEGWNWDLSDFALMGAVLFSVGLAYEVIAGRSEKTVYRVALGVGLVAAFLLFWVNGAVGIIGSGDNPANWMYGAVFAVGLIGSLISRGKSRGMARTLFAAALVQMLVPVVALLIWPTQASWGEVGVVGVFVVNCIFVLLFAGSGSLFLRAAYKENQN